MLIQSLLIALLNASPAQAAEAQCIACCQAGGLSGCRTSLRMWGVGSQYSQEGDHFRLLGLWTLRCDGSARFDPGASEILNHEPRPDEVITYGVPQMVIHCFSQACTLPAGACMFMTSDQQVTLLRCSDGGFLSSEQLAVAGEPPTSTSGMVAVINKRPLVVTPEAGLTPVASTSGCATCTRSPSVYATVTPEVAPSPWSPVPVGAPSPSIYTAPAVIPPPPTVAAKPATVAVPPATKAAPEPWLQEILSTDPKPNPSVSSKEFSSALLDDEDPDEPISPPPTPASRKKGKTVPVAMVAPPPQPDPTVAGLDLEIPEAPASLACNTPATLQAESQRHVSLASDFKLKKDPQAAINEYRAALSLDHCNAIAWADLGAYALEMGQPDRAIQALRIAGDIMPRHYTALTHLGQAYELLGDTTMAAEAYRDALRARPNHLPAQEALARLDARRRMGTVQ